MASHAVIHLACVCLIHIVASTGQKRFLQAKPSCSDPWQQCGGVEWAGPQCCTSGHLCELQNDWYSQCTPAPPDVTTTTVQATTTTTTVQANPSCSGPWQQCGGADWAGPQCCTSGYICELENEWYSQCTPVPPTVTTTTTTVLQRDDSDDCALPANTHLYSLITQGDATIYAHEVYSGIAIGGTLLDGSDREHGNIASYCSDCPSFVGGDCPIEACGAPDSYKGGTFNWLGQAVQLGAPLPFNWADFEELAKTAHEGTFKGADGCDEFKVHVSNIGGEFAMSDFCSKPHGCNPEDNGCTLVIFNTSEHVLLNQGEFGRQFGPSVIAPFSFVTLLGTAGYIDGLLVAKSFGGKVGKDASSLQMHGNVYKGPIPCIRAHTPTTETTSQTTTSLSSSTTTLTTTSTTATTAVPTKAAPTTLTTITTTQTTTASASIPATPTATPVATKVKTTSASASTTAVPTTSTMTLAKTTSATTITSSTTLSTSSTTSTTTTTTVATTQSVASTSTAVVKTPPPCSSSRATTTTSTTSSSSTAPEVLVITATTTTVSTTSTTTLTASCVLWGDPHIRPFDYSKAKHRRATNIYMSGDFWLVKNEMVHIQARYWSSRRDGRSATRAVAVGGPFLKNNTLIVEPRESGKVYWNGQEIVYKYPSEFNVPGLITVRHQRRIKNIHGIDVDFPIGVKLAVNRYGHHLWVKITIPQLTGGVDGHCGNFNGNAEDDDAKHIQSRFGSQVPGEELLFDSKEYEFLGCFADSQENRDLPVRKRQEHVDVVGCSVLCSGYKFFARQDKGQCWCGNSYGKHGSASGCDCDSAHVGFSRNCVYRSLDTTKVVRERGIEECPRQRRTLGEQKCKGGLEAARKSNEATRRRSVPVDRKSTETNCDEALSGIKDSGYRGCQTKTRSGRTCQKWTSQTPHRHGKVPSKAKFQGAGLGDHNYCRNPRGKGIRVTRDTIWCITTDPLVRWEHCDPKSETPTADSVAIKTTPAPAPWCSCGWWCSASPSCDGQACNGKSKCGFTDPAGRSCPDPVAGCRVCSCGPGGCACPPVNMPTQRGLSATASTAVTTKASAPAPWCSCGWWCSPYPSCNGQQCNGKSTCGFTDPAGRSCPDPVAGCRVCSCGPAGCECLPVNAPGDVALPTNAAGDAMDLQKDNEEFLNACVFDFCFGGPEFVEEDIIAAEALAENV